MKHAMHNWMRFEPFEETAERLRRFGYAGIEISGEPDYYQGQYGWGQIRQILDEHDLECWGAVTIMTSGRDLADTHADVRRDSVDYMKRCIDMLVVLRGQVLCIVPATVGKTRPQAGLAEEWSWVCEGLREVVAYAEEKGISPGVEPINRFETYLINRADEALELADAVGHGTGVVLDTFHMNIEESSPVEAIRSARGWLVDIHIADTNRRSAGAGQYDWTQVIGVLNEVGYTGFLTSEFVMPIDFTPDGAIREDRQRLDDMPDSQREFHSTHVTAQVSSEVFDAAVANSIRTLEHAAAAHYAGINT